MPKLRAFRALRYADEAALPDVVSPPYDVISPIAAKALAVRHPRNIVRLDLPAEEPGDEPDDRYRRAARTLAAWRSDGTLRKDPRPAIYVYEQAYVVPGSDERRVQRGFFVRLRLEPFGSGSGVLPHERTLAAPREDRYKLLRATGTNLSPVVGLFEDPTGRTEALLATIAGGRPDGDVVDDDGVGHRLWVVPAGSDGDRDDVRELLVAAGSGPITIADGHHRYETALRYRDERRMTRSCEEDPAFDYILALLLEATSQPLTVLATHRVLLGLGDDGVDRLWQRVGELFDTSPTASSEELVAAMRPGTRPPEGGRFGLVTRPRSALLIARRGTFAPDLPAGGVVLRGLDVTLLGVALERLAGIDATAVTGGGRLVYTKSAEEAAGWVASGTDGADAAFLLDPTPVASIMAVAAAGDVMPQKSTYFHPKPLSGLVMNPHEW
ncbi:MAG TPA: DUF1015 domain-containing protein [Candidatus Dormibacteraeota bacterium]|nr:DUF1015 domain-containing protein [Candidatus Dormibacteraeota bacterium]